MSFEYKELPFAAKSLEPFITEKTMIFHHDKHYKKYVSQLNELTENSTLADLPLQDVLMKSHNIDKAIFQNAAQAWNHEFYWQCLSPDKIKPSVEFLETIDDHFGSLQAFKKDFKRIYDQESIFKRQARRPTTAPGHSLMKTQPNSNKKTPRGPIPMVTGDSFQELILQAEGPVGVEFMSYGCEHCRVIEPILEEVAEILKNKEKIYRVNLIKDQDLAKRYGIQGTPTLTMFLNGQKVGQVEGPRPTASSVLEAVEQPFQAIP